MRTCQTRNPRILGITLAVITLCASGASADPVSVRAFLSGQLHGAQVEEQLTIFFPDFIVLLPDVTHLIPGFCTECNTGAAVPFTQTTGNFSAHPLTVPGFDNVDADISGNFSFTGPTGTLSISHDPFDSAALFANLTWSGSLLVSQPNRILFNGTLSGSGVASAVYLNTALGDTRLAAYDFILRGTAAETPEPASIFLFGSGAAWLAIRRRNRQP